MPRKIRELKAMLRNAGFFMRPGKGSHSVWSHPNMADRNVVMSGGDGDDAKPYQERMVQKAIKDSGGR